MAVLDSEVAFRGFVLGGDTKAISRWREAGQQFETTSNEIRSLFQSDPQATAKWDDVQRDVRELRNSVQQVTMDQAAANPDMMRDIARADFTKGNGPILTNRIRDNLSSLASQARQHQQKSRREAKAAGERLLGITIIAPILGFMLVIWLGQFASREITSRLQNVVDTLSSTSNEIAASVTEHERAASMQASSVTETTATMDELDASFQHSGEGADAAADRAQVALRLAQEGTRTV